MSKRRQFGYIRSRGQNKCQALYFVQGRRHSLGIFPTKGAAGAARASGLGTKTSSRNDASARKAAYRLLRAIFNTVIEDGASCRQPVQGEGRWHRQGTRTAGSDRGGRRGAGPRSAREVPIVSRACRRWRATAGRGPRAPTKRRRHRERQCARRAGAHRAIIRHPPLRPDERLSGFERGRPLRVDVGAPTRSTGMSDDLSPLEAQAERLERAAVELEQACLHCRTAASHFREAEVPRAAAHAWAAEGHLLRARQELEDASREHAQHSSPRRTITPR